MRLIADTLIELPFKLDFCSQKPNVDPLFCHSDGTDITLWFPPSMSDGTDGQGVFGGWAWWTGKTLRLVQEREIAEPYDTEALRQISLEIGNAVLRRFLNAYRWRFHRPDVHPVAIDTRKLTLEIIHDDGAREALTEPVSAFFYQNMPTEPPLETSVNKTTLATLQDDVQQNYVPPMAGQLRLDAEALDAQGEYERAELIRSLIK
jgi:hypothetical protein